MSNVDFILDRSGGADILKNNASLIQLESSTMADVRSNVEAQFFQAFGVEGSFNLKHVTNDRSHVIIEAADKQTAGILKANQGWLATFINNITI